MGCSSCRYRACAATPEHLSQTQEQIVTRRDSQTTAPHNVEWKPLLKSLETSLEALWELGRNLVLGWCLRKDGIDVLVLPHYDLGHVEHLRADARNDADGFYRALLTGPKRISVRDLRRAERALDCISSHIPLPGLAHLRGRKHLTALEQAIGRYGVSYFQSRAVALFDIVGFSKLSAFERLAQLNSLVYSCNAAQSKFSQRSSRFDFATSPTGDGFYVWNRDEGVHANTDLYSYVHLILADNALARQRTGARSDGAPLLKTAFYIDSYYEFFHSQGLRPSSFTFVVGDVTIALARMIDRAVPGQILIGDFKRGDRDGADASHLDTMQFIDEVQPRASMLKGLKLSGQEVEDIRCYLTGHRLSHDTFTTRRFKLTDKHGYERVVYNAKVNIHRRHASPIFLGLPDAELTTFEQQSNVEALAPDSVCTVVAA